jgi:hypothetical protein
MYPYNKYLVQSYLLLVITTAHPWEVSYGALIFDFIKGSGSLYCITLHLIEEE